MNFLLAWNFFFGKWRKEYDEKLKRGKNFSKKISNYGGCMHTTICFQNIFNFFFANRLDYFLFVRQNSDTFSLIDGSHVADIAVSMMMLLLVTIHSVTDCDWSLTLEKLTKRSAADWYVFFCWTISFFFW